MISSVHSCSVFVSHSCVTTLLHDSVSFPVSDVSLSFLILKALMTPMSDAKSKLYSPHFTSGSVGKIKFPKSTENFLHQTDIHFKSETLICAGRVNTRSSSTETPRTGASPFVYSK